METDRKIESFEIDEDNDKLLTSYTEMAGVSRTEVINKALTQMLRVYKIDSGVKIKGVYHRGASLARQMAASSAPQPVEKNDDVDCWILGKTEILGQPYCRIFFDGLLMRVPAKYVEAQ